MRLFPLFRSARRCCATLALALLLALVMPLQAEAEPLIRDAELEHTLKQISYPIFESAGLEPSNVRIFIVQSDTINAYVAGGSNIFIYTGLLKEMKDANMLIGVLAHETGHIAGGHLAQGTEKLKDAQMGTILGYVLGAAAAAAGGGDAAMAVITGSQNLVQRNLLAFTRTHEQAADQAALGYLDSLDISASGMIDVFNLLRRHELRSYGVDDPYLLTHPLSKSRIEHVRAHVERSSIPENTYPKSFEEPFQRMKAKLYAFLELPPRTFARYPKQDTSTAARIARAVAWYKIPELGKALEEMDSLIAEYPNDPYLYDLKGQILFENGKVADALKAYEKAVSLKSDEPLTLAALGEVRIAVGGNDQLQKAVNELNKSVVLDNANSHAWRLLATAHGKLGNTGQSTLALAEEALLQGDAEQAGRLAARALTQLPKSGAARIRAEDVRRSAVLMKEKQDS